jgi:hypothetical protein
LGFCLRVLVVKTYFSDDPVAIIIVRYLSGNVKVTWVLIQIGIEQIAKGGCV